MGDLRKRLVGWLAGFLVGVIGLPSQGAVHVVLVDHGQPQNGSDLLPDTRGIVFRLVSDEGPILAVDFATRTSPIYEDGFGFYGNLVQRGFDSTGQYAYLVHLPGTTVPGPEAADNFSPSIWNLDSHFLPITGGVFTTPPAEGNSNFPTTGPGWPQSNGYYGYGLGNGWTNPLTDSGYLTGAIDLSTQLSSSVDVAYLSVWAYFGSWGTHINSGPVNYRGHIQTSQGWHIVQGSINSAVVPEPVSAIACISLFPLLLRRSRG